MVPIKTYMNINSNKSRPNFFSYTIPQIKEWAIGNGSKIPSPMRKAEMINFIEKTLANNNVKTLSNNNDGINGMLSIDKFMPCLMSDNLDCLTHLHKYGWATVPIDGWNKSKMSDMFMDWLEKFAPNFNRNDIKT